MSFDIRFQEGTLAAIATIHGAPKVLILLWLRKIFTFLTWVVTTIMFGTKTVTIFFTVNWSSTVWTQLQK
jgi:hypothetical protein